MSKRRYRFLIFFGLILATVACDQVTKAIARETLSDSGLSFLGQLVRLELAENPGAFLSLGADFGPGARFWIFTVAVVLILAYTIYVFWRRNDLGRWPMFALTMIVAGGLGNLIDRVVKSTVTDFLILGTGWLRTGVFNVADVAIVLGVVILAFQPSSSGQKKTRPL